MSNGVTSILNLIDSHRGKEFSKPPLTFIEKTLNTFTRQNNKPAKDLSQKFTLSENGFMDAGLFRKYAVVTPQYFDLSKSSNKKIEVRKRIPENIQPIVIKKNTWNVTIKNNQTQKLKEAFYNYRKEVKNIKTTMEKSPYIHILPFNVWLERDFGNIAEDSKSFDIVYSEKYHPEIFDSNSSFNLSLAGSPDILKTIDKKIYLNNESLKKIQNALKEYINICDELRSKLSGKFIDIIGDKNIILNLQKGKGYGEYDPQIIVSSSIFKFTTLDFEKVGNSCLMKLPHDSNYVKKYFQNLEILKHSLKDSSEEFREKNLEQLHHLCKTNPEHIKKLILKDIQNEIYQPNHEIHNQSIIFDHINNKFQISKKLKPDDPNHIASLTTRKFHNFHSSNDPDSIEINLSIRK